MRGLHWHHVLVIAVIAILAVVAWSYVWGVWFPATPVLSSTAVRLGPTKAAGGGAAA
jgi:hypothetical protein